MNVKNVGIIGLGRMGAAIAHRLVRAEYVVYGYDINESLCAAAKDDGVMIVPAIKELAEKSDVIWLMVPAGTIVDAVIAELIPHSKGKSIVDGGNSFFKDSIARAQLLSQHGISFVDCGTSGGIHGKEHGFCLMVGGEGHIVSQLQPLLNALAFVGGFAHVGPIGAGHYIKMVHNGIEYALMQAYGQGLHLIHEGHFKADQLDLAKITELWNHGSVIRSWLLELINNSFKEHGQLLTHISGSVAESGMGLWTTQEAREHHVSVSLIKEALQIRYDSQQNGGDYSTKLVALMRNQFGGHVYQTNKDLQHGNS